MGQHWDEVENGLQSSRVILNKFAIQILSLLADGVPSDFKSKIATRSRILDYTEEDAAMLARASAMHKTLHYFLQPLCKPDDSVIEDFTIMTQAAAYNDVIHNVTFDPKLKDSSLFFNPFNFKQAAQDNMILAQEMHKNIVDCQTGEPLLPAEVNDVFSTVYNLIDTCYDGRISDKNLHIKHHVAFYNMAYEELYPTVPMPLSESKKVSQDQLSVARIFFAQYNFSQVKKSLIFNNVPHVADVTAWVENQYVRQPVAVHNSYKFNLN